jgi:hypothetical protein
MIGKLKINIRFILNNTNFQKILFDLKMKKAEEIYSQANFNFELLTKCMESVLEEKKMKREIAKKLNNEENSWMKFDFKSKHSYIKLFSLVFVMAILLIYFHFLLFSNKNIKILK